MLIALQSALPKGANSNQQAIHTTTITSNCPVTNSSKAAENAHSSANHNLLSGTLSVQILMQSSNEMILNRL